MGTAVPRRGNAMLATTIALTIAAGVMTGAQLGKIAPLVPWYRDGLGLSLVATGWLAALLGIFIAAAALPAGWIIDRFGLVRSIFAGALLLAAGGALLAISTAPSAIFSARLVEAVGYLALCIALPAALAAISPDAWKGPVLAIWSGFVPLGFAGSDLLAAVVLPRFGAPAFLMIMTILFVAVAGIAIGFLALVGARGSAGAQGAVGATLSRPVVLLACGFGAFVVLSVAMFTFMPAYLSGEGAGRYALSAGAVILTVPLGNLLAGILVRGRGTRFMAGLAAGGFAVSALVAVPAFTLAQPTLATASAIVLVISGAVVASAQFAAIPFTTPAGGSVPVAIGLVCQAGGIGTVAGPPIAAAVIERSGWAGFGWFLVAVALAGLVAMLPLLRAPSGRLSAAAAPHGR